MKVSEEVAATMQEVAENTAKMRAISEEKGISPVPLQPSGAQLSQLAQPWADASTVPPYAYPVPRQLLGGNAPEPVDTQTPQGELIQAEQRRHRELPLSIDRLSNALDEVASITNTTVTGVLQRLANAFAAADRRNLVGEALIGLQPAQTTPIDPAGAVEIPVAVTGHAAEAGIECQMETPAEVNENEAKEAQEEASAAEALKVLEEQAKKADLPAEEPEKEEVLEEEEACEEEAEEPLEEPEIAGDVIVLSPYSKEGEETPAYKLTTEDTSTCENPTALNSTLSLTDLGIEVDIRVSPVPEVLTITPRYTEDKLAPVIVKVSSDGDLEVLSPSHGFEMTSKIDLKTAVISALLGEGFEDGSEDCEDEENGDPCEGCTGCDSVEENS